MGTYHGDSDARLTLDGKEFVSRDWLFSSVLPAGAAQQFKLESRILDLESSSRGERYYTPRPGRTERERVDLTTEEVQAYEFTRSLSEIFGTSVEGVDTELTIAKYDVATGLPVVFDTWLVLADNRSSAGMPVSYERYEWNGNNNQPLLVESVRAIGRQAHEAVNSLPDPWEAEELPTGVELYRLTATKGPGARDRIEIPPLPQTRFIEDKSFGVAEAFEVK